MAVESGEGGGEAGDGVGLAEGGAEGGGEGGEPRLRVGRPPAHLAEGEERRQRGGGGRVRCGGRGRVPGGGGRRAVEWGEGRGAALAWGQRWRGKGWLEGGADDSVGAAVAPAESCAAGAGERAVAFFLGLAAWLAGSVDDVAPAFSDLD